MRTIDLAKFEQLKCTGELPSPKGPALAIIRYTQREDVGLSEIADVVKSDPAFVGRLIKAANSVHTGGRRPVVSVQAALIVLGIPVVRSMALGFSLISSHSQGNCRNFDYARYWSCSLARAVALQQLTLTTRVAPAEELFSIGLLARIGELAMATLFPGEYSSLLDQHQLDPATRILDLEGQAFVMTHSELTAAMLLDWGLPKLYVDPVLHYENPEEANFAHGSRQLMLLDSLALAQHIADICLTEQPARHAKMAELFSLGARLSIDPERLNQICDKVVQEWLEWGTLLNVDATPVPPFEELARRPEEQEHEALIDVHEPGRMRVLIVDDDASVRASLRTMLANIDHQVYEAADGKQGFEMALELHPQIMVVGWLMPEMGGRELIRALRQTKSGRGIYIMALLALDQQQKMIEAFEAGADGFVTETLAPRLFDARLHAIQRVVRLQEEIERDREEIHRFAAELAVANRRLEEVALTDTLTGLPNRRYLIERVNEQWSSTSRNRRSLACLVIDIDEFKQINDGHGHDVGDAVLKQVAAVLKSGLRAEDVLCRIGGDEFVALFPDTTLDAARTVAERMRKAVQTVSTSASGLALISGISISIGVAVREPTMLGPDALIKRADQSVYAAKQRGRNRVVAL